MSKKIISREDLQPKILKGVTEIAGIVKRTLGPGGLPIILARKGFQPNGDLLGPKITKDGVSVADECFSTDPVVDLVMQTVKSICRRTNSVAGDGTTTAIVLGEAILKETLNALEQDASLNPQLVKESVEAASKEVVRLLKEQATSIKDPRQIAEVATISANGEVEIGEIIGKAFAAVGAEGVVTVDDGKSHETTLEIVNGYQIPKGAEAREGFFNSKDLTAFEAEKPYFLIFDGKLMSHLQLMRALQVLVDGPGKGEKLPPTVIIANEFSNEAIQWMLIQKTEIGLPICACKGPHTSHVRTGYYDDIAALTAATRLGNGNRNLDNVELSDFGQAEKVVVNKYTTTIYEGSGAEADILERVDQLKALKASAETPYDAGVIADRIAALTGGIARIGVGGATELEIKEKYDRIEDALNAARAAIQEGVIPGGGVALLRIAISLAEKENATLGEQILSSALSRPFFQILDNIETRLSTEQVSEIIKAPNLTYDARNKVVVDAMTAGIIDPVKVTRTGLENAVSIAGLMSTAGGGIIFVKED